MGTLAPRGRCILLVRKKKKMLSKVSKSFHQSGVGPDPKFKMLIITQHLIDVQGCNVDVLCVERGERLAAWTFLGPNPGRGPVREVTCIQTLNQSTHSPR